MKKKKLYKLLMILASIILFAIVVLAPASIFLNPLKKGMSNATNFKVSIPNFIPTWISDSFTTKKNTAIDSNSSINKTPLKIEAIQAKNPALDYLSNNFKFQTVDNISPDKKNLIAGGHLMYDLHIDTDLDIAIGAGAMVSSIKVPGEFNNSISIHPSVGASLGYSF